MIHTKTVNHSIDMDLRGYNLFKPDYKHAFRNTPVYRTEQAKRLSIYHARHLEAHRVLQELCNNV